MATPTSQQLDGWISRYRYRPYLIAANNDLAVAVELYEWNARASAAFLQVFHYLEVLLRNAVDQVMSPLEVTSSARRTHASGWWFGDETFLTERGINAFRISREQISRSRSGSNGTRCSRT